MWVGRGRTVAVAVEGVARPVQLDGESIGDTPFAARLEPGALQVLVDPKTL